MIIPPALAGGQNSAYRHHHMKGAFGNEGALRFLPRPEGSSSARWRRFTEVPMAIEANRR
jgi:hypothetical protein